MVMTEDTMAQAKILTVRGCLLALECKMNAYIAENQHCLIREETPAHSEVAFNLLCEKAKELVGMLADI